MNPVLLRKGSETSVALYGLGNMRDERLNRMWNKKKVRLSNMDSIHDMLFLLSCPSLRGGHPSIHPCPPHTHTIIPSPTHTRTRQVKFLRHRGTTEEHRSEFFSIFVIHQNR